MIYLRKPRNSSIKIENRVSRISHSHISLLINLGFNAVDIAKRVGHESITITLRYAHMFPAAQDKMANTLNKLITEKLEVQHD